MPTPPAKAYSGMTLKEFDDYVKAYAKQPANGFSGMTYGQSHYKPMLQVFDYLKDKQVMVLDEDNIHPAKESEVNIVDWDRTYFLTQYYML
jgi:hypothetical protein